MTRRHHASGVTGFDTGTRDGKSCSFGTKRGIGVSGYQGKFMIDIPEITSSVIIRNPGTSLNLAHQRAAEKVKICLAQLVTALLIEREWRRRG